MKGFSLIELLVVIAIVTLLAGMAVSEYKGYTKKARIAEGVALVNSLADNMQKYYDLHGDFTLNVGDLGLTPNGSPTTGLPHSLDDYVVAPYVAFVGIYNAGANPANTCKIIQIGAIIGNYGDGVWIIDVNSVSNFHVDLNIALYAVGNVMYKVCTYNYYAGTPQPGNYIAGCVNMADDVVTYPAALADCP
ncbi:MAG TPA: prepilin-type N-terminal cleavage/methylation domain-containing protein [Gammaproteobacteria bacterium]|nr:prepilin-type N-terminal cleavage/methylation domain-containing protein [Gammaproteobacteria bacterium]